MSGVVAPRAPRPWLEGLCFLVFLVGCVGPTEYQRSSLWSDGYGFTDRPAGGDDHSIVVRGNAHTSQERAARMALLRAAHLTLEQGCDRFVILDQGGRLRAQDDMQSVGVMSGGQMIFVPLEPRTLREPVAVLLITLVRSDAPPTRDELDAHALIAELEPELDG